MENIKKITKAEFETRFPVAFGFYTTEMENLKEEGLDEEELEDTLSQQTFYSYGEHEALCYQDDSYSHPHIDGLAYYTKDGRMITVNDDDHYPLLEAMYEEIFKD